MAAQIFEYIIAFHQVNDSIFGSTLYVLTAFHGFHVFIGTAFLAVCFVRFLFGHFVTSSFVTITLAA
jgi:cytochrome c oxidase subunit 3